MGVRLRGGVRHGLRYGVGAGVLIACLALKGETPPPIVKFIQPRSPVVMASPYGAEVPVQLRIEPNAENKAYAIIWPDGSTVRTLDGADDSAIQPVTPLIVRLFPGVQTVRGNVYGPGMVLRGSVELQMHVCGGENECGGSK